MARILVCALLPIHGYDWPNDFVYCTSELGFVKDIGAIEILQLILLTPNICFMDKYLNILAFI